MFVFSHTLSTSKYGSSSVDMNTASSVRACDYASAAAQRTFENETENVFHNAHVGGGVWIEACWELLNLRGGMQTQQRRCRFKPALMKSVVTSLFLTLDGWFTDVSGSAASSGLSLWKSFGPWR